MKSTGMLCQHSFICLDAHFGALFIKFCSYLPYNTHCPFNANHWAQQQAAKAGIGFAPLDNAFTKVDNQVGSQKICDRLGPDQV